MGEHKLRESNHKQKRHKVAKIRAEANPKTHLTIVSSYAPPTQSETSYLAGGFAPGPLVGSTWLKYISLPCHLCNTYVLIWQHYSPISSLTLSSQVLIRGLVSILLVVIYTKSVLRSLYCREASKQGADVTVWHTLNTFTGLQSALKPTPPTNLVPKIRRALGSSLLQYGSHHTFFYGNMSCITLYLRLGTNIYEFCLP